MTLKKYENNQQTAFVGWLHGNQTVQTVESNWILDIFTFKFYLNYEISRNN